MSMQRTFHHQRATIMCSIAAVLFAFNGVAVRLLLDAGLSATRLTQIRSFGALLCFAAIVLIRNPKSLRISKADIPFLMVYGIDRKSTRLNSSHVSESRMPSSA